ncbi:MAG: feruloyl-CoA synthase [Hyphomicrobiales bacterium]|nr:feruloyl-CoA synthase [Hyphomicrobiales bacterium]MCP4998324.1 feruloyl-CoA synthase [Hyphomicrobiales bacterium]
MTRLHFGPTRVEREDRPDGAFILSSPLPLASYPDTLNAHLDRWAEEAPDRPFLAERDGTGDWRKVTFVQARDAARSVAQGLLNRKITSDRPVMIISDNAIDHALMMLGGLYAGIPVSSISTPYALMSADFGKLKYVFGVLDPSIIYVPDGERFSKALGSLDLAGVEVVVSANLPADRTATLFQSLCETEVSSEVNSGAASLTPDTIAKILFTSGSTGMPKGVINTHGMLCSNQQALAQVWPFIEERPPVLVDWLPWSHTFGGNHNFNLVLRNGGTLYIDGGKPVPGLIETTVANLKDVAPTIYFNVPRGYDQLIPFLEADPVFRDHFFSRLDTVFYAAAALPQNLWERLQKLSIAARGDKITMTSAWGSTETAPLATSVHFEIDRASVIGLPIPGTDIKMVPNAGKLEIRVLGPNVTPGYYNRPDLTDAAFDDEGFYRIGDAVILADPDDPSQGVIFDGRVAEDFKLLTGSWVSAGALRVAAIAAGEPMIQDAVVTGHDRDEIGLLVFPNPTGMAQVAGFPPDTPVADLVANPKVIEALKVAIGRYNEHHSASSQRIGRLLILADAPKMDANEITDKGYINQRAVLEHRVDMVNRLYASGPEVIVVSP